MQFLIHSVLFIILEYVQIFIENVQQNVDTDRNVRARRNKHIIILYYGNQVRKLDTFHVENNIFHYLFLLIMIKIQEQENKYLTIVNQTFCFYAIYWLNAYMKWLGSPYGLLFRKCSLCSVF